MDNMKLLRYAYDSAVTKWWRYLNIASKNSGHSLGEVATKMQNEAMADVNAIADVNGREPILYPTHMGKAGRKLFQCGVYA